MKKRVISLFVSIVTVLSLMLSVVSCSGEGDFWTQLWCEHEYTKEEIVKSPTCMEEGEVLKTCGLCGYEVTEVIEKSAHVPLKVEAKFSTCIESGYTDYVVCRDCEEVIVKPIEIPVIGHKVIYIKETPATCLTSGKTKGSYCETCGEVFEVQEVIPSTGHSIVHVPGKEASCSEAGYTDYIYCENCLEVYNAKTIIPALDCEYNDDDVCDVCGLHRNAKMIEVATTVGESVVGNWYRIYRTVGSDSTFGSLLKVEMTTLDETTETIQIIAYDSKDYYYATVFMSGPQYTIEGLDIIYTDEYIDIYFEAGTYNVIRTSNGEVVGTIVIDETTVTGDYSGSYRLE